MILIALKSETFHCCALWMASVQSVASWAYALNVLVNPLCELSSLKKTNFALSPSEGQGYEFACFQEHLVLCPVGKIMDGQ